MCHAPVWDLTRHNPALAPVWDPLTARPVQDPSPERRRCWSKSLVSCRGGRSIQAQHHVTSVWDLGRHVPALVWNSFLARLYVKKSIYIHGHLLPPFFFFLTILQMFVAGIVLITILVKDSSDTFSSLITGSQGAWSKFAHGGQNSLSCKRLAKQSFILVPARAVHKLPLWFKCMGELPS